MAKLITRCSDRTLSRMGGEPFYQPFDDWEVCEGTENMEPGTLKKLAASWHRGEECRISGSGSGWELKVRTPYSREEYRVVEDGFDVADYNRRLKEK